jgi:carbamoyltransferase
MGNDDRLILGLGGSKHDYAACLVKGGELLVAIEEERVTRAKRGFGCDIRNARCIGYCLEAAGASLTDIDEVWANDLLEPEMYERLPAPVYVPGHHLAHAASAFYPSSFSEAAVMVADHSGGRFVDEASGECVAETVSFYHAGGTAIELLARTHGGDEEPKFIERATDLRGSRGIDIVKRPRNSLGRLYARVANACRCQSRMGDGKLHTESGKLMGLAAYGDDRFLSQFRRFVEVAEDGEVRVEMGGPNDGLEAFCKDVLSGHADLDETAAFHDRAGLAWAAQRLLEESLLGCARRLWELTHCENLAVAGGVFLNGLANHRLLKETPFKRIFVQPASHDAGTAIGSAYLGWYRETQHRSPRAEDATPFLGRRYDRGEIERALAASGTSFCEVPDAGVLTARAIAGGCVVARFSGGSEFGPRALGHRSILADCRDPHMKDRLDRQIKLREPFRPYAPSVCLDDCATYFDVEAASPYMLLIGYVRPEWRQRLPAITHYDGTARVQTVDPIAEPGFAEVLKAFAALTGIGVLLNTSMNVAGEPIVETPVDALHFLLRTKVDCLVMEDFVVARTAGELARILAFR